MGIEVASSASSSDSSKSSIKRLRLSRLHNNDFTSTLACSLLLLGLSSFNYGFDVQAMAAAQAMDPFAKQFGVYMKKSHKWKIQPWFLSLLNSCHAPAQIVGTNIAPSPDPYLPTLADFAAHRCIHRKHD